MLCDNQVKIINFKIKRKHSRTSALSVVVFVRNVKFHSRRHVAVIKAIKSKVCVHSYSVNMMSQQIETGRLLGVTGTPKSTIRQYNDSVLELLKAEPISAGVK